MPHVDRLALPITFIAGAENRLFVPEGSERSLLWLRDHNDPALYRRHVIENYAHMDCFCGKNAVEDVYPLILEHLETLAHFEASGSPG